MKPCRPYNIIKKFHFSKIIEIYNSSLSIIKFINFNKKNYIKFKSKNKILVEYYPFHESILVQMNVAKILQKKFNAELELYKAHNYWTIIHIIIFFLLKFFPLSKRNIYRSFGVKKFLFPYKINTQYQKNIYNKLVNKIKKKEDILNIKIDNLLLGDLIYDGYLRYKSTETIKIDKKFFEFLNNFIMIYLYYKNYLKTKNVKAVICSHQVYEEGILNRLCLKNNIECYQVSLNYIFKSDHENKTFLLSWFNYKKVFKEFTKKKQLQSIKRAKIFLEKNCKFYKKKLLKKEETRILVATHCLYDAPHAFGKFNFTDMGDWINFLLKFSIKTNFNWYIKLHPNCYNNDKKIIERLIKNYQNIKILPCNFNHLDVVKLGITHVLSVYGSIVYEYSYNNIPVILASTNNPYKAYNFCVKSNNKNRYVNILKNIKKIKLNFNKKELYEYVYMRVFHNFNLLYNYKKYQKKKLLITDSAYCYSYFLEKKNFLKQIKIFNLLEKKIIENEKGNLYN